MAGAGRGVMTGGYVNADPVSRAPSRRRQVASRPCQLTDASTGINRNRELNTVRCAGAVAGQA